MPLDSYQSGNAQAIFTGDIDNMDLISRQKIIELTPLNRYERFSDGRPRVPDDILKRMQQVTTEEAWGVLRQHDYHFQFEGNWLNIHPERILVGRAVTGRFVPTRPDLNDVIEAQGKADTRIWAKLLGDRHAR